LLVVRHGHERALLASLPGPQLPCGGRLGNDLCRRRLPRRRDLRAPARRPRHDLRPGHAGGLRRRDHPDRALAAPADTPDRGRADPDPRRDGRSRSRVTATKRPVDPFGSSVPAWRVAKLRNSLEDAELRGKLGEPLPDESHRAITRRWTRGRGDKAAITVPKGRLGGEIARNIG